MFGIKKSFITCYDRLVDRQPEGCSQWLNLIFNIEGSIEVGVAGIFTTIARKEPPVSRSDFPAEATGLACVCWIHIDDRTPPLQSLVLDKALKLPESPGMQLSIQSSAFIFPDVSYLFHSDDIAVPQTAYNFSAYSMVFASHKPFPSARQSFKMPFGRFRAFSLQSENISLVSDHPRHNTSVELGVGSDGKMLNAHIDADNTSVLIRTYIGIFGEAQTEERSVFLATPNNAFSDFPTDIFFCVFGNLDIEFLTSFDCKNV